VNELVFIDALNGLFKLGHRSATLDGTMPLKAAQHCLPFLEGSSAGIQIVADESMIKKDEDGIHDFFTWNPDLPDDDEYTVIVDKLFEKKLLSKSWHSQLSEGISWRDGQSLFIWTGLLTSGVEEGWLLIGGAFNRRIPLKISDLVLPSSKSVQPIVIEVLIDGSTPEEIELKGEIACLLKLQTGHKIVSQNLDKSPKEAERLADFFDDSYFETRAEKLVTGRYKRLPHAEDASPSKGDCKVIDLGNAPYTVGRFEKFITAKGVVLDSKLSTQFEYVALTAQFPVQIDWDGFRWKPDFRDLAGYEEFKSRWERVVGEKAKSVVSIFEVSVLPGEAMEPFFNVIPWVMFKTPPGWSSILDGTHASDRDGLRGVVATDIFHQIVAPYRIVSTGTVKIDVGESIGRILPIPKSFVKPEYRVSSFSELGDEPMLQDS
jgi:hypothetical protein